MRTIPSFQTTFVGRRRLHSPCQPVTPGNIPHATSINRFHLPDSMELDDVLSNQDLFQGALLAFALAGLASFLQSQRAQSDFVLSTPAVPPNTTTTAVANQTRTFDDWQDIAKPDNYIWYKKRSAPRQVVEQRWVLVALLILFTPIFSFEFFLTVSRQILCSIEWTRDLCLPVDG